MDDIVRDLLVNKICCVDCGLKILNYYALEGVESADPDNLEIMRKGMLKDLRDIFVVLFAEIENRQEGGV